MVIDTGAGLPLLPTKLVAPVVRARAIQRHQLLDGLAAAARLPVTLIAAPHGFGKTTLLAQWVGGLRSERYGWVSLDAGDRDLARFWSYVVAALRGAWPPLSMEPIAGFDSSRLLLPTADRELDGSRCACAASTGRCIAGSALCPRQSARAFRG